MIIRENYSLKNSEFASVLLFYGRPNDAFDEVAKAA